MEIQINQPENADTLFIKGVTNAQAGNFSAAIKYFQEVIENSPSHIGAYYNLGNVYRDIGHIDEAVSCYKKTLQLNPNYAEAYINLGILFRVKGNIDLELSCYQKAIQINPNAIGAYYNLGHAYREIGRFDEALICYRKVLQLDPNNVNAYMNLGLVLRIKGRHHETKDCYQKVIELNPNDANAHWNLSNVLLLLGDFEQGWKEFEWFRKTDDCLKRQRTFPERLWDGFDLEGLTILLHAEEGFGDTIQFIRYATLVAMRGATIIIESQKELTSLLRNIKGIKSVISRGEKLPEFDIHCPLMSLPRIFNTTLNNIPANIPYLSADSELVRKWGEKILQDNSKFKIGLVWSGGGLPFKKSCSLEIFSPLADIQNITFYSLQKGEPAKQAHNPPKGMQLIDYTYDFKDFSDTAALIQNLDLVITVDTAVSHLSGALGKPVWTLLPFVPDWRWFLEREDSPWYPTMRLFRQPSLGDWESVIGMILKELEIKIR